MIKVSIILPSLNVKEYITECLQSVVNQTLKDIEIICVDSGSTDGTLDIIKKFSLLDERIILLKTNIKSYGFQMNLGLTQAHGEYVGIVETDDFILPSMYEDLYKIAVKNDADIVKSDFFRFYNKRNKITKKYISITNNDSNSYNKILNPSKNINIFRFVMNTWSGIYKNKFIRSHNIKHNETPGAAYQDNGFFFQTFCWAKRIYFYDHAYYFNRRDNPNSSVFNKNNIYCITEEYNFIRLFLSNNPQLELLYLPIFYVKKFHNFMFTYNRINKKFKKEYILHFSKEFNTSLSKDELNKDVFTVDEWLILQKIMHTPLLFYQESVHKLFYRIKKNIILCYKNGLKYSLKKIENNFFHKRSE